MTRTDALVQRLHELSRQEAPKNRAQFDRRLEQIAEVMGIPVDRARRLLGAVIVAQMLPDDAMVKGGIGVKIQVGETGTRATRDLDVAARHRDQAVEALAANLKQGWGQVPAAKGTLKKDPEAPPRVAFFGIVRPKAQASPAGVPPQYVMQPYTVRLNFVTEREVVTSVLLEIGGDEFDGSLLAPPRPVLSEQVAAAVGALGCGPAKPVSVISIEQQLAQKIHAATDPSEDRGHDLVDIQVLWTQATDVLGGVDIAALADLCRRTFAYRSTSRTAAGRPPHTWPPDTTHVLTLSSQYTSALEEAGAGLDEAPQGIATDIAAAEEWLRVLVSTIDAAGSNAPPLGD